MKGVRAKIAIMLVTGIISLTANVAFATKNFNSSKSNTSTAARINEEVGNILIRRGIGGAEINEVTDALERGIKENNLKTLLADMGVGQTGINEVFAALEEMGAAIDIAAPDSVPSGTTAAPAGTGESAPSPTSATRNGTESRPVADEPRGDSSSQVTNDEAIERPARTVSINGADVRGWDSEKKKEFLKTVKTHTEIQSQQDLENFATGILLKDENVGELEISPDGLKMRYRIPAKFLGIFPTSLVARVAVNAEGGVRVRYPWLISWFFSKPVSVSDLQKSAREAMDDKSVGAALEALSQAFLEKTEGAGF